MHYREFYYRWEWALQSSPETLWPLVADTNRFNRDAGVPAVETISESVPIGGGRGRHLGFSRLGIKVDWEEVPFEWVRPYRFGVTRHYLSGPVAELRVSVELVPQPEGGTHLIYQVWAQPKNWLGLVAMAQVPGQASAVRPPGVHVG